MGTDCRHCWHYIVIRALMISALITCVDVPLRGDATDLLVTHNQCEARSADYRHLCVYM